MRTCKLVSVASAASAAMWTSAALAAAPSLNLPAALADTKALLNTGHDANIVVLGDSLSFSSYLPALRASLQNAYGDGGAGYQGFSLWTGAGMDGAWQTGGINQDGGAHHSLDGLWSMSAGVGPSAGGAISQPLDQHVQIQFATSPTGGSFQLRRGVGGAVVSTINTRSPAAGVGTYNYTLAPGETAYNILPNQNGPVTILGQNNLSGATGVRVHQAANGGWGVNNFLQRDYTFDSQLRLLNTDLVMVWLGQNDQAFGRDTYHAAMDDLIDRLHESVPDAEIVLVGTYDQGSSHLAPLVEGMADAAAERGVGFINLYSTAGNADFFNNSGYLRDGVHFSDAGSAYIGNFLYNAFQSDGASLVPEPASMVLALPLIALLRRKR